MIEHGRKTLNMRPQAPQETWGFPGTPDPEQQEPVGTLLPPGQQDIPKASSGPNVEVVPQGTARTLEDLRADAEKSADFYDAALPSNFYWNSFKRLSVQKVTGRVQAKFSRAAAEKSTRTLVDAVTSLLGDSVSAMDISANDFKWLMHFILLLSYPNSPRRIVIECDDADHIESVERGEVAEATLRYVETFDRPTLKEVVFDPELLKAVDLSSLAGYDLGVYTMRDAIEWEDKFPNGGDKPTEEDIWAYDLASYLRGGSYDERAEKVRAMSVVQFRALEKYRDEVAQQHGVYAYLKTTCKECGTENVTNVTVSVRDFL